MDSPAPISLYSALLFRSDVRANLVERPTVSQSVNLFGGIVRRLARSFGGKQSLFERRAFRQLMMEINSVGGYRLLDCLPEAEIEQLLDTIIGERLRLTELKVSLPLSEADTVGNMRGVLSWVRIENLFSHLQYQPFKR